MLGLGMDRLEADINRLLASLFHEGVLDEQFLQLHQLQDETSPTFVYDVINIYFDESDKLLHNLRLLLSDREFWEYKKIGLHLNQLVGSSSSIGARRLRNVCVAFRSAYELNNRLGCLKGLEILEYEYHYLKNMMHELFQLEQQRLLAAGVRYPILYGFRQPVEASLVLAGTVAGDVQPSMVSLMQNPGSEEGECAELRTDGWYEVDLGHFFKRRGDFGEIQMTLKETEKRPSEKKGLVLLGIEIRPMP